MIERLGLQLMAQLEDGSGLRGCHQILFDSKNGHLTFRWATTVPYYRQQLFVNQLIEIVMISWNPHQGSRIHDHPDGGCLLRVMAGHLTEEVYYCGSTGLQLIQSQALVAGDCSYQEGQTYVHRITNPTDHHSLSLHVYSPPHHPMTYYEELVSSK